MTRRIRVIVDAHLIHLIRQRSIRVSSSTAHGIHQISSRRHLSQTTRATRRRRQYEAIYRFIRATSQVRTRCGLTCAHKTLYELVFLLLRAQMGVRRLWRLVLAGRLAIRAVYECVRRHQDCSLGFDHARVGLFRFEQMLMT